MMTQMAQPVSVLMEECADGRTSSSSSSNRSHNSGGICGVCHDGDPMNRICRKRTRTATTAAAATTKRQLTDCEHDSRPSTTRRSTRNNQRSKLSTTTTQRPNRRRRRARNSTPLFPSRSVRSVAASALLLLLLYFTTTTSSLNGSNVVAAAGGGGRTEREREHDDFEHNDYDDFEHDEYVDDYCQPPNVKWDWERLDYYELLGLVDAPPIDGKKKKEKNNKNKNGSSKDQSSSFLRWNGWNNQKNNAKNGLKELADTSDIDMKQIRKAYRRAAQIYHPDKATTTSSSATTASGSETESGSVPGPLSVEESTARFAKIAEAYEVLSDPSKRKEYDTYLEHCYRHKKWMMDKANPGESEDSPSFKERFSKLFDSVVSVDPFAVFDDLFTGAEDDDDDDNDYRDYFYDDFHNDLFSRMNGDYSDFDPRSRTSYDSSRSRSNKYGRHNEDEDYQYDNDEYYERYSQEPSRVYQHQQNLFDPMTGEVVVRVSQTEEYRESGPSSSSSSQLGGYFFRIVSQDFKQRVDTHTGDVLLIPLTHPYVQEEGHRRDRFDQQPPSPFMFGASNSHSNQHSDDPQPEPPLESILHSWEVMTPNTRLLVSPNGKYVAGLSPDCELLIMVDDEDVQERDGIVWSSTQNGGGKSISDSSRYGYGNNNKNTNQCFAILKESHLIVAVGGSMGHQHPVGARNDRILWYSDGEDNESASGSGDDEYFDYEDEFGMWHRRPRSYLAQLDNDGSLTIYSVWSLPRPSAGSTTESSGSAYSRSMIDSAKDLLHGRVRAVDYGHLYYPSFPPSSGYSASRPVGLPIVYKRCIYSTSPLGCSRVGRRLVQLSLEMYFRIKGFLARFNHATDAWLDLIYEEDDLLLGFKESVLKNGSALGSRMASSSARFVRRVMEFFEERGL